MKFFIDNNLGPQLADGMKGFGENVMHLQDEFPPGTIDTEWIPYVGKNNLFLVTRDLKVRWRPYERKALKEHKVGVFFLGGKNRTKCQLIQQLVRHWPRMKEYAKKERRPFAFVISPRGTEFKKIQLP